MTYVFIDRASYYRNPKKKGHIIVYAGPDHFMPIRVTNPVGSRRLETWVDKHRRSPIITIDNRQYMLFSRNLHRIEENNRVILAPELYREWLKILDTEGFDGWSFRHDTGVYHR